MSQPLSASMSINNGEEKTQTVVPASQHSSTEVKQLKHCLSSVQPTLVSNNQSFGDPAEQLAISLSNCSVPDLQCDTSDMISDNIALRYA